MSTDLEGNVGLSPYYLNTRRLEAVTTIEIPAVAQTSLNSNSIERVTAMRYALNVAKALLNTGRVPNLARAYAESEEPGRILASTWGSFSFKGSRQAFDSQAKGKLSAAASFTGTLNLGDRDYPAHGELITDHYYSQSSIGMLSGRRPLFLMGIFEFGEDGIEIFPYVIGDLIDDLSPIINMSIRSAIRVYPDEIGSFGKMRDAPNATAADIKALQAMPEAKVKDAVAEIIGEPFVPADWGGETSDLQTNRLTVRDTPHSAAFILKGPALKGQMHPGNMGKRGDQLVRAFGEPVDLIVIQHCNKIANSVVKLAEALAIDPRNPKRFCILDGADTARLLKAYAKLPSP